MVLRDALENSLNMFPIEIIGTSYIVTYSPINIS